MHGYFSFLKIEGEVGPRKTDEFKPCHQAGFFYGEDDDGITGKGTYTGTKNSTNHVEPTVSMPMAYYSLMHELIRKIFLFCVYCMDNSGVKIRPILFSALFVAFFIFI